MGSASPTTQGKASIPDSEETSFVLRDAHKRTDHAPSQRESRQPRSRSPKLEDDVAWHLEDNVSYDYFGQITAHVTIDIYAMTGDSWNILHLGQSLIHKFGI